MQRIMTLLVLLLLTNPAGAALKTNSPTPGFSLPDRNNRIVSLSDVIGGANSRKNNGVIVSFFASWCGPCREELRLLHSLLPELNGKDIAVVIIGVREDHEAIAELLRDLQVDMPIVLSDRTGKAGERYQVRFLPVTFFIGADGNLKDIIFGQIRNATELRNSAAKLYK
jgi:thiol-disulfide isomerase/thioredoxin